MGQSRFYVAQDLAPGSTVVLEHDLTHYLRNVLRIKPDDQIILFNGQGGEYPARITAVQKREVTVFVDQFDPVDRESQLHIRLGIGIVKRDAMDAILRKSTELGVSEIQPVIADLTTISTKAIKQRAEHWRKITISACEQCGRNTLPNILAPMASHEWITHEISPLKLALDPSGNHSLMDISLVDNGASQATAKVDISVLIGPEGGLSRAELALAESSGFLLTGLGQRILRADTAPVAVLSVLQARFGDLLSASNATRHTSDSI